VQPMGVDVASGVESAPGVKDLDKVARFLTNARRAFARMVNP
jgi:phosphoribosylanthranilate isomerase